MTGMTPAWLTFSGMYVLVPPYMRRPIIRLAYCTGMRRCACSTNTTSVITTIASRSTAVSRKAPRGWLRICPPWDGMLEMIEVKISTDMPLPTPRSVTSSPSHMITAVPAVRVMTRTPIRNSESSGMIFWLQPWMRLPERASATMPVDCRIASATVR